MTEALTYVLDGAILVHLVLLGVCLARLLRGSDAFNRLLAVDLIGTLLLAVAVLFAIRERQSLILDVAMGLAAVGFMGSILLAKYIADVIGPAVSAGGADDPATRALRGIDEEARP